MRHMLLFIIMVWLTGQAEASLPWSLEGLLERATRAYIAEYKGAHDSSIELTVTEAVWGAKEDFPGVFRVAQGGSGYRGPSHRFFVFDQVDLVGVEPKDLVKLGQGMFGQSGYCGWIRLPIEGEGAEAVVKMPSGPGKEPFTLEAAKQLARSMLEARGSVPGTATVTAEAAPIYRGQKVVGHAKKGDRLEVLLISRARYGVLPSRGWIAKEHVEYRPRPKGHKPSGSALDTAVDKFTTYCEFGLYCQLLQTYWHPNEKRARCKDPADFRKVAETLYGDLGLGLLEALRSARTVAPELSEDGRRAVFAKGQKRLVIEKDREGTWCLTLEGVGGRTRVSPEAPSE